MVDESNTADNLNNPNPNVTPDNIMPDNAPDNAQGNASPAENSPPNNPLDLPDDLAKLLNAGDSSPADYTSPSADGSDNMPTDTPEQADDTAPQDFAHQDAADHTDDDYIDDNAAQEIYDTIGDHLEVESSFKAETEEAVANRILYDDGTIYTLDVDSTAIGDVSLKIVAEVGATDLRIEQLMKIGRGAIIEIDKDVDGTIDLRIGNHLIATAQLESKDGYFTVRILELNTHNIDEHHTLFHAMGDD